MIIKSPSGLLENNRLFLIWCYAEELADALNLYWHPRFPRLNSEIHTGFVNGIFTDGETLVLYQPADTCPFRRYMLTKKKDVVECIMRLSRDVVRTGVGVNVSEYFCSLIELED